MINHLRLERNIQLQAKIVRKEESLLEVEIAGENHTFLNLLRESLKDQEGVLFAAYRFPHPLLENPIFYLRTEGINPIDALKIAADTINKHCEDLTDLVTSSIT
ncbi:DNA-directed RNA polymerase subunit L [Candidatus Heimdallarchaeota archaeon B3_Heim]|nr:MAG: DNA-directed RNA polymerase subunit L [Candidatus Heimdallarchaeota archaeon B3_Heim]